MPYPAQINPDRILEKAREMLEAESADRLSLHELAGALGVKAPSLYRYYPSKTDLLRALNLQTVRQLIAFMSEAAASDGDDARMQLLAMARAWRTFAHTNTMAYALAFTNANPELRPDDQLLEALAIDPRPFLIANHLVGARESELRRNMEGVERDRSLIGLDGFPVLFELRVG